MAAFTVWKFDGPDGAQGAASVLKDCEREGLVKIVDHAVVSWPEGAAQPTQRFHGLHSKLIATNLTDAERQVLLETFGGR